MTLKNIFFLAAIVSLTACSAPTFGLKPIYPENICSRYDLNVWLSENDSPSSLIYSRRCLPEPRHEMEEPLLPCAKYFWTVRVSFLVNGKERVSEWGISAWPWFWQDPYKAYGLIKADTGDEIVRRSPVVPHPNLYRFMAPCPEKAEEPRTPGIP